MVAQVVVAPPFFPCPQCHKEVPLEVLEIGSKEADELCLLCESEGICRPCSKRIHSEATE